MVGAGDFNANGPCPPREQGRFGSEIYGANPENSRGRVVILQQDTSIE
jgi:hypothetical protein